MNRRTGLGRHGRIEDAAGDPLDGLVNLFDIGIVLAVAFLIAGLGLTLNQHTHRLQARTHTSRPAHTDTAITNIQRTRRKRPRPASRNRLPPQQRTACLRAKAALRTSSK